MNRHPLLASGVVLLLAVRMAAFSTAAPAAPASVPPIPISPAIRERLTAMEKAAAAGQFEEALQEAKRAGAMAREAGEKISAAVAQRNIALLLERLNRGEEAVAAWREAAALWEQAGEGLGRVEALAMAGVILAPQQPSAAAALVDEALEAARAERKRALLAARTLIMVGAAGELRGQLAIAQELYTAALKLLEPQAPDSPEMANSLMGLGNVARSRGDLAGAQTYHRRALTIWEKRSPRSVEVAGSLMNLGNVAVDRGDLAAAAEYYQRARSQQEELAPVSPSMTAILLGLGITASARGDLVKAREYYERALALQEKLDPNSLAMANLFVNLGNLSKDRGDQPGAHGYFQKALVLQEKLAPHSPTMVAILIGLGQVAQARGDLNGAHDYYQRALTLQQALSPFSPLMATVLNNLGDLAMARGDLVVAQQQFEQALALRQQGQPRSLAVVEVLNNLGNVANTRGDIAGARDRYQRALALQRGIAPDSLAMARLLNNLGTVFREQGDLATAQAYYQEALALVEKWAPRSPERAAILGNLGVVALTRRDFAAARSYHQRALTIEEKENPRSREVAYSLVNLGNVAREQGYPKEARLYYQRALALLQEATTAPSLVIAVLRGNLGNVVLDLQEFAAARREYQRVLTLVDQLAPESLALARALNSLGTAAFHQRDLAAAADCFERALALQERLAPGSLEVAGSLRNLGLVAAARRDLPEAERRFRRAWELVVDQRQVVTSDVTRQAFGALTQRFATNLVQVQVARGKTDDAFRTVEESRAQALRQLFAERHLDLGSVPAARRTAYQIAITDRERAEQRASEASSAVVLARRALETGREQKVGTERLNQQQAALTVAAQRFAAAQADYTRARLQVERLWDEIKRGIPLLFTPSLPPTEATRALSPGSLLVEYLVGPEQAYAFALRVSREGQPSLDVYPIALSLPQLRAQAGDLWRLTRKQNLSLRDRQTVLAVSRKLFLHLFPVPLRRAMGEARRLLIAPDDVLWSVPFAALVTNARGVPRYLGVAKPLTYVPSLTLFAQARGGSPRLADSRKLVALVAGDLIFSRTSPGPRTQSGARNDRRRSAPIQRGPSRRQIASPAPGRGERALLLRAGETPEPLPHTRAEAVQIAKLYGVQPLLGEQGEESAVRKRMETADLIHLATHGRWNPVRTMSSGVLLTMPPKRLVAGETANDGVLQAWEIYSQLKLKAELVVLSACETGLGENVPGEGIVGLTRALQHAGARSVLASLWQVQDDSTLRLMTHFHQALRQGLAKDEALRQAMEECTRHGDTARPYHWAAFFLLGDPENLGLGARRAGR